MLSRVAKSKVDYQPFRHLASPIHRPSTSRSFLSLARRAERHWSNRKAPSMRRNALVVSLLMALLNAYSGSEGININTTINAPVNVIHSK
jgi:hypothetical protein